MSTPPSPSHQLSPEAPRVGDYRRGSRLRTTPAGTWFPAVGPSEQPAGLLLVHPGVDLKVLVPTIERLVELDLPGAHLPQPELILQAGRNWLVTDGPPVPTLADILDVGEHRGPGNAAALLTDVATTLLAVHEVELAHGGVDGRAVLVGPRGTALLTDWGTGTAEAADDVRAWTDLAGLFAESWCADDERAATTLAKAAEQARSDGLGAGIDRLADLASSARRASLAEAAQAPLASFGASGASPPQPKDRPKAKGKRSRRTAQPTSPTPPSPDSAAPDPEPPAAHPEPPAHTDPPPNQSEPPTQAIPTPAEPATQALPIPAEPPTRALPIPTEPPTQALPTQPAEALGQAGTTPSGTSSPGTPPAPRPSPSPRHAGRRDAPPPPAQTPAPTPGSAGTGRTGRLRRVQTDRSPTPTGRPDTRRGRPGPPAGRPVIPKDRPTAPAARGRRATASHGGPRGDTPTPAGPSRHPDGNPAPPGNEPRAETRKQRPRWHFATLCALTVAAVLIAAVTLLFEQKRGPSALRIESVTLWKHRAGTTCTLIGVITTNGGTGNVTYGWTSETGAGPVVTEPVGEGREQVEAHFDWDAETAHSPDPVVGLQVLQPEPKQVTAHPATDCG